MKTITYIINWLIVCLCCCVSGMVLCIFECIADFYLEGQTFPAITQTLLGNPWILWTVPVTWGIVTVCFLLSGKSPEKMMFHISTSILLGLLITFIHIIAGILPFIPIVHLGAK